MTQARIGFCCKMLPENTFSTVKERDAWTAAHNTRSTTVAALDRLSRNQVIDKICGIILHNQEALKRQFHVVGSWEPGLAMMRIGSEILPVRTFDRYKDIYDEPVILEALDGFQQVGDVARQYDIRLSTHPGQFSMLCSNNPDVILRSIEDLEYHGDIFRLMGYDGSDADQEINIHGGAKRDDFLQQFRTNLLRLSADTRKWISVENDEYSYGLDDLLPLASDVKILVDINHHWIHTGEYLQPTDPRMLVVKDSWRGARPEIHVAYPHEQVLLNHDRNQLPDRNVLNASGISLAKLRAHSDDAWLDAVSHYALGFWEQADLCVEAKWKNLASKKLYKLAAESK